MLECSFRRARRSPRRGAPFLVLIAFAISISGCSVRVEDSSASGAKSEGAGPALKTPEPEAAAILVELVALTRGPVRDTITLSGDLEAEHRVEITSRIAGQVREVLVREGDHVAAGTVLVKLDDDELRLATREQEHAHRDAVAQAQAAELALTEASGLVKVKKLLSDKAEREHDRVQQLISTAVRQPLSQEEVDAKRYARDEARLAVETAELAVRRSAVAVDQAHIAVERAKVAAERAQLDWTRTQIIAPLSGAVSFLEVRPGESIQVGARIAALVNQDSVYTEVRVPQRRLAELQLGQRVEITAETVPGRVFIGRVDVVHPTVDPTQGTVKVRVTVAESGGVLRPGTFVSATIVLTERTTALLIPKRARVFDGEDSIVFTVKDGIAKRLRLKVGLETIEHIEVLDGGDPIAESDQIVVRGQTQLRDGARVKLPLAPVETPAAPGTPPAVASPTTPAAEPQQEKPAEATKQTANSAGEQRG
ncbi:MAG: efflux RND transporter periplasmic adaptor subunit [Planctomycetota bacterium]